MSKRIIKKTPLKTAFGNAVKRLRIDKKLSQMKLAELADVHINYIASVEKGELNVGLENICKLAKGLNTHPADLFKQLRYPFRCTKE